MPKINFEKHREGEKPTLEGKKKKPPSFFSSDVITRVTNQTGSKELFV